MRDAEPDRSDHAGRRWRARPFSSRCQGHHEDDPRRRPQDAGALPRAPPSDRARHAHLGLGYGTAAAPRGCPHRRLPAWALVINAVAFRCCARSSTTSSTTSTSREAAHAAEPGALRDLAGARQRAEPAVPAQDPPAAPRSSGHDDDIEERLVGNGTRSAPCGGSRCSMRACRRCSGGASSQIPGYTAASSCASRPGQRDLLHTS